VFSEKPVELGMQSTIATDPASPKHWWQTAPNADKLRSTMKQYLEYGLLDADGVYEMKAYLRYWINAPIWKDAEALQKLRDSVVHIENTDDIRAWLAEARRAGTDPTR
jgi:hypothetical protein